MTDHTSPLDQWKADAAAQLAEAEAADLSAFIGKTIVYDPQPHGARTVLIETIRPKRYKTSYYPYLEAISFEVSGTVVEGHEVSRLFTATSARDISGRRQTIYGVSLHDLKRGLHITAICG